MSDDETLKVYDEQVEAYAGMVDFENPGKLLNAFMEHLTPGGFVLDLGCGPANSSVHMRNAGFRVDPVDASPEMVRIANDKHDIGARVATFDDLVEVDHYDGVWANFSLLHSPKSEMPKHLAALSKALKHHGIFHIGMKTGEGEKRDNLGRFYAYYTEKELEDLLHKHGFEAIGKTIGEDVGLAGDLDAWITVLSRKV